MYTKKTDILTAKPSVDKTVSRIYPLMEQIPTYGGHYRLKTGMVQQEAKLAILSSLNLLSIFLC